MTKFTNSTFHVPLGHGKEWNENHDLTFGANAWERETGHRLAPLAPDSGDVVICRLCHQTNSAEGEFSPRCEGIP